MIIHIVLVLSTSSKSGSSATQSTGGAEQGVTIKVNLRGTQFTHCCVASVCVCVCVCACELIPPTVPVAGTLWDVAECVGLFCRHV